MKISSFNPMIKSIHNQCVLNERKNFNNLTPLTQDTISFGASASAKKLVEKLKAYNPNGQYNIKQTEAETIYKYFGYEVENGRSSHKTVTGPYGQTYTYSNQSFIDPSNASALIRGIQMADEFNGELLLFSKKPSDEQILEWKQRIAERTPTKGFENSYAIDNKERLDALHVQEEETFEVDSSKEQERAINELKCRVSNIAVSISHQEEDFEALVGSYEEIKENAIKNQIEIPQEEIQKVDKQIAKKREDFSFAKSTIETFKDKLSKNNMLSEEEISTLDTYENEDIDISDAEDAVINFEDIYSEQESRQTELVRKIIDEITEFKSNIGLVNSQAKNIKKIIDEAAQNPDFKESLIDKLNTLYFSLEKKLSRINTKVDNYKKVETTKKSISKLNSILNKIKVYNNGGLGESIPELLELNKLIETEVKPMLSITEDEKTAKRVERIEKFNKKVEQSQVQAQQNSQKQTVEDVKKTVTEVAETTPSVEAKPIEQKIEISPAEKTAINVQQQRIKELNDKIAKKISPLPIAVVYEAMSKLVEEKFDDLLFTQVQNGNTTVEEFATKIATAIVQTPDYNRIKNAAKFALLNSIYTSSTNHPNAIFDLNGPQARKVFAAIKNGEKEITIYTNNKPIKISIGENHNLSELDKTFTRFNTKTIEIEEETGKKIADEVLKYAPTISEKELPKVLVKLSNEGAYYELLVNENCNETLKTTLLKTFWSNYDSDNKTNYTPQVISKYEAEQRKIKEAEMQKRKLESISNLDWSL